MTLSNLPAAAQGPHQQAIGRGQGDLDQGLWAKKPEAPLINRRGQGCDRLFAVKQEHQPVFFAFVGFLTDGAKAVKFLLRYLQPGFFSGLAYRTLMRALPGGHLQLAANGAPAAQIGRLGALDQKQLSGRVS